MPTTERRQRPRRISRRIHLGVIGLSAAVAFALGLTGITAATGGGEQTTGTRASDEEFPDRREVIKGAGADRYPSSSAADWVTYADHVVVATVVKQRTLQPSKTEVENGEGLLRRKLTMSVDKVVWSSPHASVQAPDAFAWQALGWEFTSDPEYRRRPMTLSDQPRLEKGHTYIMAIEHPDPACVPDESQSTSWRGLGSGAVLPFDASRIGGGEFEGSNTTPAESSKAWNDSNAKLAARIAGKDVPALERALKQATPDLLERGKAREKKCSRAQ